MHSQSAQYVSRLRPGVLVAGLLAVWTAPVTVFGAEGARVLVKFVPGTREVLKGIAHDVAGAKPLRHNEALDVSVVTLPAGADPAKAVQLYLLNPVVAYAEVDIVRHLHRVPNDTLYQNPPADPRAAVGPRDHQRWMWDGLGSDRNLDAEAAWDRTTGRADVVVAMVDTGVDLDHPDLAANIWVNPGEIAGNGLDDDGNGYVDDVNGYDFRNNDPNPDPTGDADGIDNDFNGYIDDGIFHGTFGAGLAVGRGDNGTGAAGAAWNAKVMALRIFDDDGGAFLSDIVDAITYAADNGAHVANYSFGSGTKSHSEQNAVAYAHSLGVVQVSSAGNGNSSTRQYPASYSHVISVGASDHGSDFVQNLYGEAKDIDGRAWFSQYGTRAVDVVAPGHNVLSTLLAEAGRPNEDLLYVSIPAGTGQYGLSSGTSFSAPIVSGLAALIISRDLDIDGVRNLSNDAVETHIQTYTVDLPNDSDDFPDGGASWDGSGRVSFRLAIEALGGPVDQSPSVTINSPANGSCHSSGSVTLTASASDAEDGDLSASVSWSSSLDGALGVGASISAVLSDGTHSITASVTDSASQSDTDQITITVGPAAPNANAGPDQTVTDSDGSGSEAVTLNGSGSSDPCGGAIASYEWFEASVLIATGATPTVSLAVGTHTITLVVTDSDSLSDSDTVVVTVNPQPTGPTLAIAQCVTYTTSGGGGGTRNIHIEIFVQDDLGNPVSGASVSISVTRNGSLYGTGTGTTGTNGRVLFTGNNAPNGIYVTTVTSIVKAGLAFEGTTPANSFNKGVDPTPAVFCQ